MSANNNVQAIERHIQDTDASEYVEAIEQATLQIVQHSNADPVLLSMAHEVQDLGNENHTARAVGEVALQIDGIARFKASYFDGTGRGIRESARYVPTVERQIGLTTQDRLFSEANKNVVGVVSKHIRSMQPGEMVQKQLPWGQSEDYLKPHFTDGENTAYQVTSVGTGFMADKMQALIHRPIRFEGGKPVDNNRYPSDKPEDYTSEQIEQARNSIVYAWSEIGASDSYRVYPVADDELSDVDAIKLLHWSEEHLAQAVREEKMPRWWEGDAIAVLPKNGQPGAEAA